MRVRVKAKEWSYNSKHTNVRKRIKRLAHKQERRELNTLTYSYELANDKFNEVFGNTETYSNTSSNDWRVE